MNNKEHLKALMVHFLKQGQQIQIDPSKAQIMKQLIDKLQADLVNPNTGISTDAEKDVSLFLQDLSSPMKFVTYLFDNKVTSDAKRIVIDYTDFIGENTKIYFPFPEKDPQFYIYKDGIEKFIKLKLDEAEKSTDLGFKNILKTRFKFLMDQFAQLSPSLQIIPESKTPTGDTIDMIPATLVPGNPSAPGQYPLTLKDLFSYTSMLNFFNKFKIPYEASKKGYLDAANVLLERAKFKKDRAHLDKLESRRF